MSNMVTVRGYTFFAKETGVEIKALNKQPDAKGNEEGAIMLRFFGFKGKGSLKPISFQMTPPEAYAASAAIMRILFGQQPPDKNGKIRQTFFHKKQVGNQEHTNAVSFEYWENGGRSGFGVGVSKTGMEPISVSITPDDFGFMSELLKSLSTIQAYQRYDASLRQTGGGAQTSGSGSGQPHQQPHQPHQPQPPQPPQRAGGGYSGGQQGGYRQNPVGGYGGDRQASLPPHQQQQQAYVGNAHDPFHFEEP